MKIDFMMPEQPVQTFTMALSSGEMLNLQPPNANTYYVINSIYSDQPINVNYRPSTVGGGSGGPYPIISNQTVQQSGLNLPSMNACYLRITAVSFASVYVTVTQVTGPQFYLAQVVGHGAQLPLNLPSGGKGFISMIAYSGGQGATELKTATFPLQVNALSNTSGSNEQNYFSNLKIGIDDTNGVFVCNNSTSQNTTAIIMGVQTQ